jgi:hypothetical protein
VAAWPLAAWAQQPASNIELLDLVSTPAAADWDAAFTVKRVNLNP